MTARASRTLSPCLLSAGIKTHSWNPFAAIFQALRSPASSSSNEAITAVDRSPRRGKRCHFGKFLDSFRRRRVRKKFTFAKNYYAGVFDRNCQLSYHSTCKTTCFRLSRRFLADPINGVR